jgi:antitoxin component of MazEF toxin-antitoxin module
MEKVRMIKHLTKHGNSLALVIDRGVLELLQIKADTPLSLTTDGKCLVITPARAAKRRESFRTALKTVNRRYRRALKRLAD